MMMEHPTQKRFRCRREEKSATKNYYCAVFLNAWLKVIAFVQSRFQRSNLKKKKIKIKKKFKDAQRHLRRIDHKI
jgi:hypothetical protein